MSELGPVVVDHDSAATAVNHMIRALLVAFDPDQSLPPTGGGTTDIKFVAGEGVILEPDCENGLPFVWVRLAARFRTKPFPEPAVVVDSCGAGEAITLEVGVARCAYTGMETDWTEVRREAEISLDDSWRLSRSLCWLQTHLKNAAPGTDIGYDTIAPYGPEGGIIGWSTNVFIGI